jgi:HTH-type transcriptional regulator / antitoxin HigA
MTIKPIKTEDDYDAALNRLENVFDAEPGTKKSDELEVLAVLIEAYEEKHWAIPDPEPIPYLQYFMEIKGYHRADLARIFGGTSAARAEVSNIFNYRRPLSLRQIRMITKAWQVPPDVLMQEYELRT